MRVIIGYLAILITLIVGDAAWLSFFAKRVFRPTVGNAALEKPRIFAAVIFYLLYAGAVLIFPLGLAGHALKTGAIYGAAFGFSAYMTYDLTNLATLKPWTLKLALMDVIWGTLLTGAAASLGVLAARQF